MQVELRFLAGMKRYLREEDRGRGFSRFDVPDGVSCDGLMKLMGIDSSRTLVVLVNGRHAGPDKRLVEGDVVAVFPPVAGG
jgi:molybdopterin converting factor small subunit